MKKIIITCFLLNSLFSVAQTCCSAMRASTESFAALGNNRTFMIAHEEPLPFILTNKSGKDISYKVAGGKDANAYEVNPDQQKKVIFVIHEWWGLNDYIKQEAEKIAKETGARVIALDLYDKKVASTRDSAGKLMKEVKTERAEAIIKGALNYVGKEISVGTIGWCFGGGWSLQASLLAGKQAKACVMYYGMPEDNMAKLKNLNAPVFFVGAYRDKWITPEVIAKFEENMKAAGKKFSMRSYDADHAFANPSNPGYGKAYADDAFKNVLTFFKENLN